MIKEVPLVVDRGAVNQIIFGVVQPPYRVGAVSFESRRKLNGRRQNRFFAKRQVERRRGRAFRNLELAFRALRSAIRQNLILAGR